MTTEELKRIMYEDPERYQYIMRTAHSGRTGRIDHVYDPELDGMEPEPDYLSPSKATEQMTGYRPTLGREAVYNDSSSDPYTTYMNSTYVDGTVDDTVDNTAKIAQLEEQIAQVQERIARNKRALVGKSYEDVNNQLAQLELDKIGFRFNGQQTNTDPTSFWRWNQARVDTNKANDLRNAEAKNKFENEISKWENRQFAPNMTAQEVWQEIKNLENAIQEGKNIGKDVSRLEAVRQKLLDRIGKKGTTAAEDKTGEYETFLVEVQNGLHTADEIDNYADKHEEDLTFAQYNKLRDAAIKAGKKEKAAADAKAEANVEKEAKELFEKEFPGGFWNRLTPEKKKEYKDRVRGK